MEEAGARGPENIKFLLRCGALGQHGDVEFLGNSDNSGQNGRAGGAGIGIPKSFMSIFMRSGWKPTSRPSPACPAPKSSTAVMNPCLRYSVMMLVRWAVSVTSSFSVNSNMIEDSGKGPRGQLSRLDAAVLVEAASLLRGNLSQDLEGTFA